MGKSNKQLKITLVKSLSGRLKRHQATAQSLGLRKIHQSVIVEDIPSVRGKLEQVKYLIIIEEV